MSRFLLQTLIIEISIKSILFEPPKLSCITILKIGVNVYKLLDEKSIMYILVYRHNGLIIRP